MQNDIITKPVASNNIKSQKHTDAYSSMPMGVRLFAWVRAIRWFGWGFGESLLPIFILSFSHTFAEAGLFSSTVEFVSLMSLPVIGMWADRVPAKRLVLWSLILYPLVGLGYLLAGIFGLAVFIVLARAANGFTWELENVGVATYYRRVVDRRNIAASFGYLDTWTNLAWIAAAIIGMFLVAVMPIHYLLFAIAPFSFIAYFVALRAPKDPMTSEQTIRHSVSYPHGSFLSAWRTWTANFWLLSVIVFFSSIVSAFVTFFIPISAYLAGANLPMVVLLGIFGALPALFGYLLGRIADKRNRYVLIAFSLFCVAIIAVWLAAIHAYWLKLSAVFLLGVVLELLYVVQSSLITTLGPAHTYGKRGSAFESISTLGDLVAPLVLGVALDVLGFSSVSFTIAATAVVLAGVFIAKRRAD
jgi:MFS transporter, DHA1 family, multidrug resistance protein